MNYLFLAILVIILIFVYFYYRSVKKIKFYIDNAMIITKTSDNISRPITRRTPDAIILETPQDKSYKMFCNICKKNVDKIMVTGACSSCYTPNVPK